LNEYSLENAGIDCIMDRESYFTVTSIDL